MKPTLAEVYRAHAQTVARWARYLGGQEIEVEDVVQDVFMTVSRLLGPSRIEGTASSRGCTALRKTPCVISVGRIGFGVGWEVRARTLPASFGPADELERRRAQERLHKVLCKMRERYRTVFILAELEGLSGEEIASMMDTKLSTVWVWLHRARADFADRLDRLGREERR